MGCKELQLKQNYLVQLKMQFALKPRVLLSLRHKLAQISTLSSVVLAHIELLSLFSIPQLRKFEAYYEALTMREDSNNVAFLC